jgi:hypothetical protein
MSFEETLLIRGFWERGTDCIIDVCHGYRCQQSRRTPPRSWKPTKKRKEEVPKPRLEQRRHFTPFVVSTDGLIGKEAKTLLKKLSSLLKWEKSLLGRGGYVNAQVSIAIVRAHTTACEALVFQPAK